jgi:phosphohistidine phosphatase
MNLYLVQHAEARAETEDPQRSVSDKGYANVDKTARWLSEKVHPTIHVIIHSGKLRAKQTAEVLADYLAPIGGTKAADGLEPGADPAVWAKRLDALTENVMLVGHQPHLGRLVSRLLCGDDSNTTVNFTNAGIVCLSRDDSGAWSIQWMIVPGICG